MNVVFRVDSATHIGTGHVMRCLTLANALAAQGAQCHFVCRGFNGNMAQAIQEAGYSVYLLPYDLDATFSAPNPQHTPAHANWLGCDWQIDFEQTQAQIQDLKCDWLVVDHYALDNRWEAQARTFAKQIMVIDDLADRSHDCELLLEQNLGRKPEDYQNYVPKQCQLLIGPQYVLLRPEFAKWRAYSLERRKNNPQLKTLLISLGGSDSDNITGQVLTALEKSNLPKYVNIQVIMGAAATHIESVKQQVHALPWQTEVLVNVNNMAELMANADLAIGAAGSSSWERCCLGLPTLMLVLADNQKSIAQALIDKQAAIITSTDSLDLALNDKDLINMTQHALSLCDGQGLDKVTQELRKKTKHD